jgi:hypothetical protein
VRHRARDVDEPRKRQAEKLGTIDSPRRTLQGQANTLSTAELVVHATVLDVRWL